VRAYHAAPRSTVAFRIRVGNHGWSGWVVDHGGDGVPTCSWQTQLPENRKITDADMVWTTRTGEKRYVDFDPIGRYT